MSNAEKMVMVPREPTDEMILRAIDTPVADTGNDEVDQPQDYRNMWLAMIDAAPAQQGQGEPVADVEQWWADTPDGDSALVMRVAACGQVDILRAQLTEAHALLRDAVGEIKYSRGEKHGCKGLDVEAAEALLSASAEPSAPTFADGIKNPPEWVSKHLASKAEPSAPVEPLIPGHRLEAIDELLADADPQSDAVGVPASELRDLVSAVRSFQVRALTDGAPVEIDERAEFDKWYAEYTAIGWSVSRTGCLMAWQARAALERKP